VSFPRQLAASLGLYLLKNWTLGRKQFPLVLMLEPTERCNLNCAGCGRIREYRDNLDITLTADQCLEAVEEVGAPVVTLTGGEPLLHPQIQEIAARIIGAKRHVHLCTNGLLLEKSLGRFKPGPYMNFVVHADGPAPAHDHAAGHDGVFERAMEGIKAAKRAGFRVYTNTTVFRSTDFAGLEQLFNQLVALGVDGLMISPAFDFGIGADIFPSRDEITQKFQALRGLRGRYPFYNTSAYLDFLEGERDAGCMPWSTPTLTPRGWRRPCYLLADEHCGSYQELVATDWSKYGVGKDPRCQNCMVHSGFEASLIDKARHSLPELTRLARG
jgi:hopanoid biosynthesis associated radical SAM protein HpnH